VFALRGVRGRRLGVSLILLLGVLLATLPASAVPARVLVFRPEPPSPVLEEAIVRVRGELGAVGLLVEVRPIEEAPRSDSSVTGQGTYGVLVLEHAGDYVRVRAYSPDSAIPVEQQVDSNDPHVDAEVIAVRAVETLRAVMLEYARRAREKDEDIPDPVTGFTRIGATPKKPAPPAPKPAAPRPSELRPWFGMRAGPELALDTTRLSPNAGVSAAVRIIPDTYYFFELGGSMNLLAAGLSRAAGDVEVDRSLLDLRVGGLLRLSPVFDVFASAGGGVGSYGVVGRPGEGFVGRRARHLSALVSGSFGCELFPTRRFGAYASLLGTFALDAPRVRVDGRSVATAKAPELAASLGVALRL
jgi:hypothetical protein